VPDATLPKALEVYAIDSVTRTDMATDRSVACRPFFSMDHQQTDEPPVFWYAARRGALSGDGPGTEVFLSLVDLGFDPRVAAREILAVRTLCTNGDVPYQLAQTGRRLDFELAGSAPLSGMRLLGSLSPTLRPPLRRGAYWRLVSHLALNHLSLTDAASGRQALQEILRLYDVGAAAGGPAGAAARQRIEGITAVGARPVVVRTAGGLASGFARGVEVTIELDEEMYIGTGAFLFGSVLERFLGLYCSVNSFCQLAVRSKQSGEILKRWPPRAGQQILL
jgi:type VI secretion system protein ImpG